MNHISLKHSKGKNSAISSLQNLLIFKYSGIDYIMITKSKVITHEMRDMWKKNSRRTNKN